MRMPVSDRGVNHDVSLEQNRTIVGARSVLLPRRLDQLDERQGRRNLRLGEQTGRHSRPKAPCSRRRRSRPIQQGSLRSATAGRLRPQLSRNQRNRRRLQPPTNSTVKRPFMQPAQPREPARGQLSAQTEPMPAPEGQPLAGPPVRDPNVHPAPPIEYDTDHDARKMYRSGQVQLVMVTQDPSDGCCYEIPLCIPACCTGEPKVSGGREPSRPRRRRILLAVRLPGDREIPPPARRRASRLRRRLIEA